nr:F-box protein CPR1-like [Ziziphus jujuba var. spinosa]
MEEESQEEDCTTSANVVTLKDIIDEILVKLPLKDLARFKCVSKSWSKSIKPRILDHEASSFSKTESKVKQLPFPLKRPGGMVSGSFKGLLCIRFWKPYTDAAFILWNPEEYNSITIPYGWKKIVEEDFVGFGYDNYSDDYKIIRCYIHFHEVDIYSLKTNSWKNYKTPYFGFDDFKQFNPKIATLVNVALYWPVTPLHPILYFDLADEKITSLQTKQLPSDCDRRVELKLMVYEGKSLCAYQSHFRRMIHMWVLTEEHDDDDQESRVLKWTKLMSTPHLDELEPQRSLTPLSFRRDGELVLQVRKPKFPRLPFRRPSVIESLCLLHNPEQNRFEKIHGIINSNIYMKKALNQFVLYYRGTERYFPSDTIIKGKDVNSEGKPAAAEDLQFI